MTDGYFQQAETGEQRKEGETGKPDRIILIKGRTFCLKKVPEHDRTGEQPEKRRCQHGNRVAAEASDGIVIYREETGNLGWNASYDCSGSIGEQQESFAGLQGSDDNSCCTIPDFGNSCVRDFRILRDDFIILRRI